MSIINIYDSALQHMLIQYHERNISWGSLHIALEDGNLEDSNINFCFLQAFAERDLEGMYLAEALKRMTMEEREKIYQMNL